MKINMLNQVELWEQFGRNVRSIREEIGLSPRELARKLGYRTTKITHLEDGTPVRDTYFLYYLCDALGTTLNGIMDYPPEIQE